MKNCVFLLVLLFGTLKLAAQIDVHRGQRYLETKDGKPFFWLGDTAWELFHRMTREDARAYLRLRRAQGYNVIQAVALAEEDGLGTPNRYGDVPLIDNDPTRWAITPGRRAGRADEYDYWDHVDYVIKAAAREKLYIGLLPTWGDKVAHLWGVGPIIFNAENARAFGRMIGARYADQWNVIWILGGDRPAVYRGNDGQQYDDRDIWRAMAAGIREGEGGRHHLMTYHPAGGPNSSSHYLHADAWVQMNAFQSGHGARETPAWEWVARDLALQPPKPTIDLEPCYEDHPVNPWDGKWTRAGRGYFDDYDVRARTYRSVFAGACGVTYGHHQIWQFVDSSRYRPVNVGDTIIGWQRAMHAPGAYQMQHLKHLLLSRPYFSRVPDPGLLVTAAGSDYTDLVVATRDSLGTYAMVYLPQNRPVTIDLARLRGGHKQAWWYDPRTGEARTTTVTNHGGPATFTPPAEGKDWVLVIDDAALRYSPPGRH